MRCLTMEAGEHARGAGRFRLLCIVSLLLYAAVAGRAQDLHAGYAKADITPNAPVMLGGYDLRSAPSDGIWGNDRLYARGSLWCPRGLCGVRRHRDPGP